MGLKVYSATPKFNPGNVAISEMADQQIGLDLAAECLSRHLNGDWGDDLPAEDIAANDAAYSKNGAGLYSWYNTPNGRLLIVTYVDRETFIILPEEY